MVHRREDSKMTRHCVFRHSAFGIRALGNISPISRDAIAARLPFLATTSILFLLAFLSLLTLTVSADLAAAEPSPKLINPIATLKYGESAGVADLVLQVDGLDPAQKAVPNLVTGFTDLGSPSPPNVAIKVDPNPPNELFPAGATARSWLVKMAISGLPANTSQKRHLRFDLAGKSTTLEYTLSNMAIGSFSWAPKVPASIAIEPGQAIPLSISVGPVPATGVALIGPFLSEKTTKYPLAPEGLKLCRNSTMPCESVNALPANSATQLWLQGASGIGEYDGTITIASNEKPGGDPLSMTVFSTTTCRKLVGIVVIFLSVLFTWYVTVYARNYVTRSQLLLPATLLRDRFVALQPRLEGDPTRKITEIINRIEKSLAKLTLAKLEAEGLPRSLPTPWNDPTDPKQIENYRRVLQELADWSAALEAIIRDGLKPIWSIWDEAVKGKFRQVVIDATADLDAIAKDEPAPKLDTLPQKIKAEVDKVEKASTGSGGAPFGAAISALGGGAAPLPSYEQLTLQIARISIFAWIVVILGTTLAGAMALVLNSSFGSLLDFVKCVAWGLGVPLGAQALATTTLGSVATSFGITVKK
jgi:hypothetical protein